MRLSDGLDPRTGPILRWGPPAAGFLHAHVRRPGGTEVARPPHAQRHARPISTGQGWRGRLLDRQAVPVAADPDPVPAAAADPVLDQRRRIAGWVDLGQKVGYGLFGLAIVAFVVGFAVGFASWAVTLIVVSLVVGSIVLAPAIVFGYGVRAADRADREDSW